MRVNVVDGFDDPLDLGRWIGRSLAALNSKRGQAFLRELRSALLDMPQRRLIDDALYQDGEVCALGALGLARGMTAEQMARVDLDAETAEEMFGCTWTMAWHVIYATDDFRGTPEERHVRVLRWVDDRIEGKPIY